MKILFTCVGRRVELVQCFKETGKRMAQNVVIYGADTDITAPALQFCDISIIVPRIEKEEQYLRTLQEVCVTEEIDLLIPTIDTDLLLLSQKKKIFEPVGTKVLISTPDKITICRDKTLTYQYFMHLGLKAPLTIDDVQNYQKDFPAFIKPKDGSSSINAYKVESMEELLLYTRHIPDYIIQPFIEGKEYTVDVFCDMEGRPIYITPRIRCATRAGEVLKTQIDQDPQIIEEVLHLVKDFKPCGPITIQLIKDEKTNINWYIEINPRFGGGVPLSMKAGADSVEALIRIENGMKLDYICNAAENGAIFSRFDQSVRIEER